MGAPPVYCFPDTNIFIHFQTFNEVDWNKLLETPQVCLVITPVVFDELNKFKDDSRDERRRKRVRTILPLLEKYLDQVEQDNPAPVRPGVVIIDLTDEPMVDWQALRLDPTIGDDRLLASMLEFIDGHPGARVVFVADDLLARRKAKRRGIEVLKPDGLIERKELASPQEAEIKELRGKLQAYENRAPKVNLAFYENGNTSSHVVRAFGEGRTAELTAAKIDLSLEQEKQKLDEIAASAPKDAERSWVRDYISECKDYLRDLKIEMEKLLMKSYGEPARLALIFQNTGSAPIEEVDIDLYFPAGSFVIGECDIDDETVGLGEVSFPPMAPTAEWRRKRSYLDPALRVPNFSNNREAINVAREPTPEGPLYDETDRSLVSYYHPKLRHKDNWMMEPVIVYLPPDRQGGFEVRYVIRSQSLLTPIEDKLTVKRLPQS